MKEDVRVKSSCDEVAVLRRFRRSRDGRGEDFLLVALVGGYLAIFFLSQVLAYWIRFQSVVLRWIPFDGTIFVQMQGELPSYVPHFQLGLIFFVVSGIYFGIFERSMLLKRGRVVIDLLSTMIVWACFYLLLSLFFRVDPLISRFYCVLVALLSVPLLFLWHRLIITIVWRTSLGNSLRKSVLVIGWNADVQKIVQRMREDFQAPYRIVGAVEFNEHHFETAPPMEFNLGSVGDLRTIVRSSNIDAVLLADLNPSVQDTTYLVNVCHKEMVTFMAIPAFFEVLLSGLRLQSLGGVPVVTIGRLPLEHLPARMIKRVVDIVGACVGLLLAAPICVVVGFLIYRESPGPIFFSQERFGRRGRPFKMYKLRSMCLDADKTDHLSQSTAVGDARMLKVGAVIRRWNIDELPQFWNVLRGDMSLVGPRPERVFHSLQLEDEITHYNIRLAVKPGLTGWAAVNGLRGNTDLNARVRFDIEYIERWSLSFDLYIMALTFVRNRNAY
jgi:exopolysaccharide biosynthesis polyprenyl glycosylphosphotransferase